MVAGAQAPGEGVEAHGVSAFLSFWTGKLLRIPAFAACCFSETIINGIPFRFNNRGRGMGKWVSGEGGGGSEPFGWLGMRERYLFLKLGVTKRKTAN